MLRRRLSYAKINKKERQHIKYAVSRKCYSVFILFYYFKNISGSVSVNNLYNIHTII